MRIVAAGARQKSYTEMCIKKDVSKLYSFLIDQTYIRRWNSNSWLMVDSGAHSWNKFTITKIGHQSSGNLPEIGTHLKKYAAFMKEFKDRPWIFVEFDVYGHLEKKAIDEQYSFFSSIVGRDKFIRVYHPIIDGGTLKVLDEWIEQGQSYIGVGNDSISYLDPIFKRTRDRVKVHGFAMTKFDLLTRYPFYSVDSTSPLSAFMYGSYSKGSLKKGPKQQLIKNKDPDFFKSPTRHMIEMVDDLKKTEKFLTNLWEKRGVVWND